MDDYIKDKSGNMEFGSGEGEIETHRDNEKEFSSLVINYAPMDNNVKKKREELGSFQFVVSNSEGLEYISDLKNDSGESYYGFMLFFPL